MAGILAIAEQREGALRKISEEAVAAAAQVAERFGGDVHALIAGPAGTASHAEKLGSLGAAKVFVAENDAFSQYNPDALSKLIAEHIRNNSYDVVIFGGSSFGKDLAPRVAARLDVPLASDVTALDVEGQTLVVTRPMYAGRVIATVAMDAAPRIVSVRPNSFRAQPRQAAGSVETLSVQDTASRLKVREVKAASAARVDVSEASIVVSGGRGLKGPENWHLLEKLCEALGPGAALGASRAVVDAGWRPHSEQVGQTGKTVSPQLYFAIGISGAMQHLAGMRSARTIVAINKDPDAPIFKVADYGIVGDATEVVPRLIEALNSGT